MDLPEQNKPQGGSGMAGRGHAHADSGIDLKVMDQDLLAYSDDYPLFTPSKSADSSSERGQFNNPPSANGGSQLPGSSSIAICGVGVRLPGGIRNTHDFWELLVNGRDACSPIPSSRYNAEGFDHSLGGKSSVKTQSGYFLTDDLASFDPSLFSMTKNELDKCDPYQRLLLEVTRECLEDAGEVNYRNQLVGCYVGAFGDDWLQSYSKETQHSASYNIGATGDYMVSNRVCYEYGFLGPRSVETMQAFR